MGHAGDRSECSEMPHVCAHLLSLSQDLANCVQYIETSWTSNGSCSHDRLPMLSPALAQSLVKRMGSVSRIRFQHHLNIVKAQHSIFVWLHFRVYQASIVLVMPWSCTAFDVTSQVEAISSVFNRDHKFAQDGSSPWGPILLQALCSG